MQVKHQFVSGIPDDPNAAAAGEVLPSHWNADHQVTLTGADISGALGYTPYDAANPTGYVTEAGARAALSAVSPVTYNPATGQIGFVETANAFSLNRLENGDFQVFQRNGGAPVTGFTGSAVHLDRWNDVSTNAVLSISRDSEALPNTWRHYRRQITTPFDPATNTINQCYVQQGIETQTLSDSGWGTAGAQPITISFEVRSSVTGNHAIALRNNTPGGPKVYVTTYSIPVANVFTPVSVTIPGDQAAAIGGTQNFLGLSLTFCHGAGSVYTATTDTWLVGEYMYTPGAVAVCNVLNATWDIRKVKIELGSSATAFEIKNVSESVAICRRMYEQGTVISRWGNGANIPVAVTINYKTIKRASPTLQITMTSGTLGTVTSLNTDSASITGTSNGSGQFDFSWAALTEI